MQWIWVDGETEIVNTYAEFKVGFRYTGGRALLDISVFDEYAVFVNGVFADCGQYDDYPHYKIFDTLDLASLCRAGDNELLIRVCYQGTDTFQCVKSAPGLWFSLALDGGTVESGPETLARFDPCYTNGPVENISPQLGFTFRYDARGEGAAWAPAQVVERPEGLLPRPIKKLAILPPSPGVICRQGVFLRPDPAAERTTAERIYTDLTAPRYTHGFVEPPEAPRKPACADPGRLLRWVDTLYTEEGAILGSLGQENVDYVFDGDGTWRLTDKVSGNSSYTAEALINSGAVPPGISADEFQTRYSDANIARIVTDTLAINKLCELPFPDIHLTAEQTARVIALQNKLGLEVDLQSGRWIIGEDELTDASVAAFREKLDSLGLPEFMSFWQQLLDQSKGA